jgi:arginyl-tRNA synthetase
MRQLREKGYEYDADSGRVVVTAVDARNRAARVDKPHPEIVEQAALQRAPQVLVHYLRDLANDFHTYYNAHTFIVEEAALRNARLTLIQGLRQVVRNGLALLGVSAPETM